MRTVIAGVPFGRIYLHPVAIAAWVGMFATSLNLLPGGQLDGGHIIFAVSRALIERFPNLTILALIPMAVYFWTGWLIWAILLRLSGMRHPAIPVWPEVTPGRRWLAVFALLMLVLTFAHIALFTGRAHSVIEYFRIAARTCVTGMRHADLSARTNRRVPRPSRVLCERVRILTYGPRVPTLSVFDRRSTHLRRRLSSHHLLSDDQPPGFASNLWQSHSKIRAAQTCDRAHDHCQWRT